MVQPIRLAQVVEAFEGGCKRHVLGLLSGLDRARFSQTAIVSPWRDEGAAEQIASVTGNAVETVLWDVRRAVSPRSDVAAYRFLGGLLRERDFDIVHCHSAKAGFLGRLAARGLRASVLYTPHCFPFLMDVSAPRQRFYRWLERFAGKFTDRLIAVSPSEAEIAARTRIVPEDQIATVENGIDPQGLQVEIDTDRKRAELGVGPDRPVVLSVGALRPQKGHRYLIEAVPDILQAHPQAAFPIAGEGELRSELETLVSRLGVGECVRLLGSRDDVPELLAVADCFVIPSLWEGGPYALLEAMAAGVPVVGSRIPGIMDWVRDGETGYEADPADPGSVANAVAAALSDRAEAGRRAQVARKVVVTRNTEQRWLREMAEVYEEAARRARAEPASQQ